MPLTHSQQQAIKLLEAYLEADKVYDNINKAIKENWPARDDFPPHIPFMNSSFTTAIINIADELIEEGSSKHKYGGIARYFVFECCNMKDGGLAETYKLKTLEDLEVYIDEVINGNK
jgi:hypothetical protein